MSFCIVFLWNSCVCENMCVCAFSLVSSVHFVLFHIVCYCFVSSYYTLVCCCFISSYYTIVCYCFISFYYTIACCCFISSYSILVYSLDTCCFLTKDRKGGDLDWRGNHSQNILSKKYIFSKNIYVWQIHGQPHFKLGKACSYVISCRVRRGFSRPLMLFNIVLESLAKELILEKIRGVQSGKRRR